MKKLLPALILLVLTGTYSYCQSIYPKKILFKGDTCVAISIAHVKALNLKLQRKQYVEMQYSLVTKQNEGYLKMLLNLRQQINERDGLIHEYRLQVDQANDLILGEQKRNKTLSKKVQRKKKLEKIMLGTIGALIVALIFAG